MEEDCGGDQGLNWAVEIRRERSILPRTLSAVRSKKCSQ
jgi:hypothetical protein